MGKKARRKAMVKKLADLFASYVYHCTGGYSEEPPEPPWEIDKEDDWDEVISSIKEILEEKA